MPDEAELLQGNLFGDSDKEPHKRESPISTPSSIEFSEQELIQDARARPRKNQKNSLDLNQKDRSNSSNKQNEENRTDVSNHSLVEKDLLTPVLRHYVDLKEAAPERILLYRLGDFFECFFEDAIELSRLLELTLTGKEGGKAIGRVPMAGIPHHAAERYCAELIKKGFSIAICDQLEVTAEKGGLLKRGITRILTPGTIIEEGMLTARRNNWLAAVVINKTLTEQKFKWGLANADVSTGEFVITQNEGEDSLLLALSELNASEIIWDGNDEGIKKIWCPANTHLVNAGKTLFSLHEAENSLKKHFKVHSIKGFGLEDLPFGMRAAGGLITYLKNTKPLKQDDSIDLPESVQISLDLPKIRFTGDSLTIDSQTRRNLELTTTQRDGLFHGSLLWALDRTYTAMGARCLRRWLESPLVEESEILSRQNLISNLVKEKSIRNSIRKLLKAMGDLERLSGRAGAGQAGARDIIAIADALKRLPKLSKEIEPIISSESDCIIELREINPELSKLESLIRHQLVSSPPLSLNEGGIILDNVDPLLDGLRNRLDDHNKWLKGQEDAERRLSKITNLKLQYHRTFGYFLSVNKSKSNDVPNHWIRRQTLSNEERFITPSLKEQEGKIFQAKARTNQREYEIFSKLREDVGKHTRAIRKAARAVACLDALASLAEIAATNSYCCPKIIGPKSKDQRNIIIKGCRHPVVEQLLVEEAFQENDVKLGSETDLIILTGPNASGKSCYLRQIGLIQILAQIGSWVPAREAELSITDRIFTRVGAVDDLTAGQSTFMVEMTETALILNQATDKSLVLLDEIGRGTATFDGLSIAWAVSECLANEIKSRTIFATHYHELNTLSEKMNNVENFQVLVEETGDDLIFLHKVAPGGASRSYGIEAARLSGVPITVIKRAKDLLSGLENKELIINNEESETHKLIRAAA